MLRPVDEALIDFEKTYRQIFKQPLFQHQQYTKRQLIYNYAGVGSQYIHQLIQKQQQQNQEVDLQQIIKNWNNKSSPLELLDHRNKQQQISQRQQTIRQEEDQEEISNFHKEIQVIKKQKLITKSRAQRNVNYRKQLQILFKTRNLNMLNVQSMRSHFMDLKPYVSYKSRHGARDRQSERYNEKNSEERENVRRNDQRESVRRNQQRESVRKNDQRESYRRDEERDSARRGEYYRDRQRGGERGYSRDSRVRNDQYRQEKSPSNYDSKQESFYQLKPPSSYYPPPHHQQRLPLFSPTQFPRPQQGNYQKYNQPQISHNQNYQNQLYQSRKTYTGNQPINTGYHQYDGQYTGSYSRGGFTQLNRRYSQQKD